MAVLKEKRAWLVAALARELEPAFSAHARHLRYDWNGGALMTLIDQSIGIRSRSVRS